MDLNKSWFNFQNLIIIIIIIIIISLLASCWIDQHQNILYK